MELKRVLRLPDGTTIMDQEIEKYLDTHRRKPKKNVQELLQGVAITPETLVPYEEKLEGTLEVDLGQAEPFRNRLFEKPDIKFGINREGEDDILPWRNYCFILQTVVGDQLLIQAQVTAVSFTRALDGTIADVDETLIYFNRSLTPEKRARLERRREELLEQLKQQVAARLLALRDS